jgi:hypothetical protein
MLPLGVNLSVHRSTLSVPNKLSAIASSQQLALQLIDAVMVYALSSLQYFMSEYCRPKSVRMVNPTLGFCCRYAIPVRDKPIRPACAVPVERPNGAVIANGVEPLHADGVHN